MSGPIQDAEVVSGEVVDESSSSQTPESQPGTDLAHRSSGSTALIDAPTAAEKVAEAQAIADALNDIIVKQGLRTKIGRTKAVQPDGTERWVDKYHVNVEAWQTLATLLGLGVVEVYTRPLEGEDGRPVKTRYTVEVENFKRGTTKQDIKNGTADVESRESYDIDGFSWESKYSVVKDGVEIASASAMCGREETKWARREEFALKSMAQTRAQARAIAAAARWIVTLAGYAGTPAEEMPQDHGPDGSVAEASDELKGKARDAIRFLGRNNAKALADKILASNNGTLPVSVATALVYVEAAQRASEAQAA
jgi:hypothetical protein